MPENHEMKVLLVEDSADDLELMLHSSSLNKLANQLPPANAQGVV